LVIATFNELLPHLQEQPAVETAPDWVPVRGTGTPPGRTPARSVAVSSVQGAVGSTTAWTGGAVVGASPAGTVVDDGEPGAAADAAVVVVVDEAVFLAELPHPAAMMAATTAADSRPIRRLRVVVISRIVRFGS
jgi:hypothetical protein